MGCRKCFLAHTKTFLTTYLFDIIVLKRLMWGVSLPFLKSPISILHTLTNNTLYTRFWHLITNYDCDVQCIWPKTSLRTVEALFFVYFYLLGISLIIWLPKQFCLQKDIFINLEILYVIKIDLTLIYILHNGQLYRAVNCLLKAPVFRGLNISIV